MHGNPYLIILRRQLKKYIAEQRGPAQLATGKQQGELARIKKETTSLKRKLSALEAQKAKLERALTRRTTQR